MKKKSGNLQKVCMFIFNMTFWVQIFKMRNFCDVYFHHLNLQKLKQFMFFQFFKKSKCFWLKFAFTEYLNRKNFPFAKVDFAQLFFLIYFFIFFYHKTPFFQET